MPDTPWANSFRWAPIRSSQSSRNLVSILILLPIWLNLVASPSPIVNKSGLWGEGPKRVSAPSIRDVFFRQRPQ
jgi:hypothetical protein